MCASLPIKDAAKIAVLSTIWRDVWSNLTQLNFDYDFFGYIDKKYSRVYGRDYAGLHVMNIDVVNKVLLQHNGTIRKFVLNFPNAGALVTLCRSFYFNQWLLLITQKSVEEIRLDFVPNIYSLPNCIFSCLTLKRLHLYGVIVEPMNFSCILPNVTSLCFGWVDFGPINLLDCAIHVPLLENLSFIRCQNMFHFDITAPKLCSLTIDYCFPHELGQFLPDNLDLRSISTLNLQGSLQKFVKEFTGMGFQLNVEYLKLSCFYHESDVTTSALVHLLRLYPKLCKLEINLSRLEKITKYIDLNGQWKLLEEIHSAAQTNKMLHALKLISFRGSQPEILFINELLASFTALEKVVIIHHTKFPCNEEFRITQELLHFSRATTKAEIIFV